MTVKGNSWLSTLLISCTSLSVALCDTGYFWHVTDYHYDHTYWTDQLSCNNNVSDPGQFGDYWCDSPWRLVQDSITNMAAIKQDVDFIIWTGDNVAHIDDQHMSLDINLQLLQNVTDALNASFRGVAVYPSLGNHDFYPSDQAASRTSAMYEQMARMWAGWIQDPEQIQLFKKGGYYTRLIRPKLRLLALNTVLYLQDNNVTKNTADPADQLAWTRAILKQSRQAGEKVIVTAHVPPMLLVPDLMDWLHPLHHAPYLDLMTDYSDIIVAQHYGHDHSDSFKILQRNDKSGASPVYTAPSVTPWRYKTGNETGDPHNPGFRLVEYDRLTGVHLNYHQYYINLTNSNRRNRTDWRELYNFRNAYGVKDMSVDSLRQIYDRMKTPDSPPMLAICKYRLVSHLAKPCPLQNQAATWCGGQISDLDLAKKCVKEYVKIKGANGPDNPDYLMLLVSFFLNVIGHLIDLG